MSKDEEIDYFDEKEDTDLVMIWCPECNKMLTNEYKRCTKCGEVFDKKWFEVFKEIEKLEQREDEEIKAESFEDAINTAHKIIELAQKVGDKFIEQTQKELIKVIEKKLKERKFFDEIINKVKELDTQYDALVKQEKILDAHNSVITFKKKYEEYSTQLMVRKETHALYMKDEVEWSKYLAMQEEIKKELKEIENLINIYMEKKDFKNADAEWSKAKDKLAKVINEEIKQWWYDFEIKYLDKKKDYDEEQKLIQSAHNAIEKSLKLAENFSFDEAIALLSSILNMVNQRNLHELSDSLIQKRESILRLKAEYEDKILILSKLEQRVKEKKDNYLLLEVIRLCDEIIDLAPLVRKTVLLEKYTSLKESINQEFSMLQEQIKNTDEQFDKFIENSKNVEAHELVLSLIVSNPRVVENPTFPAMQELIEKDKAIWNNFQKELEDLAENLKEIKEQIKLDMDKNDFFSADNKWQRVSEILSRIIDKTIINEWDNFENEYLEIKRRFEEEQQKIFEKLGELELKIIQETKMCNFQAAEEHWNQARQSIEKTYNSGLKNKWIELERKYLETKEQFEREVLEKLSRFEHKFEYNYNKNMLNAALNYCNRIIETAPLIGKTDLVNKYTDLANQIKKKIEEENTRSNKEREELLAKAKELDSMISSEEDVLPLVDEFTVNELLGSLADDVADMMEQINSLLDTHHVEVKDDVENIVIMKSKSGEMEEIKSTQEVKQIKKEENGTVIEPIEYNFISGFSNPFNDNIEEAIISDIIPYNFEITNIELNGEEPSKLPNKVLTKEGLELNWKIQNIQPTEKIEINYDLRKRVSRTVILTHENQIKVIKTHSKLNSLEKEGLYDANLPFTNPYSIPIKGVIIEDIIPLYYINSIEQPKEIIPEIKKNSILGDFIKWQVNPMTSGQHPYKYKLIEIFLYEEIKINISKIMKETRDALDTGKINKVLTNHKEAVKFLEEFLK